MLSKKFIFLFNIILIFFTISCGKKVDIPFIENNISYPGSIVALNSTSFLLLNTSANGDYRDGSIQQYNVDSMGNQSLINVISVPAHGTELAVSPDSNLVALSFDNSVDPTQIQFYNYTDKTNPQLLSNVTLSFFASGAKQSIKRLGFFTPTNGGNYYYLYGVIYSFQQDDGSYSNIPTRVFVAKIARDFSSASVLFTLSYGIGDPNSLAAKSDSNTPYSYSFGSNSPSFDSAHNLLFAFPTGSNGGFNTASNVYPPIPNVYSYMSGQANANVIACSSGAVCAQPDMRALSLFAVDFTALLNGEPLNNSTYFVPLAWNSNGIPYGATTNSVVLNYANAQSSSIDDLTSYNFQTNFWSSRWVNYTNLGNNTGSGPTQCYTTSNPTTSANEYNLNSAGSNGLLVAKSGVNGNKDTGYGNEVLQITGLDIVSDTINYIKLNRGGVNQAGENDFKLIAATQILDPFNSFYTNLQTNLVNKWLNGADATHGVSPIVPYMYSRTTGVSSFDSTASAAINFGVLNFGSNSCLPYWVRDTYLGFGNLGIDSAWLSSSPVSITTPGSNATFYNASIDPTQPFNFAFSSVSGAELCTDLTPVPNQPKVFCVNFLRGDLSRFNVSSSGAIFTQY